MERECSFCGDKNVVLISGYNYCIPCSRKLDRTSIHNVLSKFFSSLTMEVIKELCTEMFGSGDYCFSMFPKLYPTLSPGKWIEAERRHEIGINDYLIKVFLKFLQANHPKIFERINHE